MPLIDNRGGGSAPAERPTKLADKLEVVRAMLDEPGRIDRYSTFVDETLGEAAEALAANG